MKKLTIIAILLITVSVLNAQTTKVDSLKNQLQKHRNEDTVKINLLLDIGSSIMRYKPDSAINYAKNANIIANNLDYKKGLLQSNRIIASIYYYKSTYDSAIYYFQKCLHISEEAGKLDQVSRYYNNIGLMYFNKGDNKYALDFYNKSLNIHLTIDNKGSLSFLYNNIGMVYERFAENQKALEYYQKSLKIKEELNLKKSIPAAYNNIGVIYKSLKNYPKALEYFQKSLSLNRAVDNPNEALTNLNNIALIYSLSKDYEKSLDIYNQIIETKGIDDRDKHLCKPYISIANIYFIQCNYKKAIEYNNKSLKIAIDLGLIDDQALIYEQLSKNYFIVKSYKKAYESHVLYKELLGSIVNKKSIIQLTQLDLEYEFEKEKQALEFEQQKKDAISAKEIKYQKTVKNVYVIGLFVAIFITILFYRIVRIKKKANNLLHIKNKEISDKKDLVSEQKTELEAQTEELNRHKEHLEEIVEQRTFELQTAKERAEESDQLKTEFIHNMSHEIRTPLNGILGFSGFLNNPELKEETKKHYVNIIQSSGKQLLKIINDILEISKLATKQVKIVEKVVSLNALLSEHFSILDIKAKEKNIELRLNKELSDEKSSILTDKIILNTILENLLENALKFTKVGFIEFGYQLKTDIEPAEIEIYVKDTGIGIKAESQEIIFKRFSQEEKELFKNVGGLGLGLSIAKENTELLGGKITIQSEKGKGATFFVTIPYKPVNSNAENNKTDNDNGKITQKPDKYTILIVEDEEVVYLYLDTLLEDFQLNVKTLYAKHGKEAVEICKENSEIDFVLMDLKMPIMTGFEATKLIKEIRPKLPIVAQTAYSAQKEKEQAFLAGCDGFISKPISKETLNKIINKYLIMKE